MLISSTQCFEQLITKLQIYITCVSLIIFGAWILKGKIKWDWLCWWWGYIAVFRVMVYVLESMLLNMEKKVLCNIHDLYELTLKKRHL